MAITLGPLVTRIFARLKDPTFTSISRAEGIAVINDAITFYSDFHFFFNEFKEDVTLVIDNPVLPALVTNINPTLIFNTGGIVINYGSMRWDTLKISSEEYDARNVQGQGIPYAWTFRAGQYELYYYPDAAYTAVVRGLKSYTAFPTAQSDPNDALTNDFLVNAANLIMYEALSRLVAEFRQDDKMEAYYSGRAKNEFDDLKKQTRRLIGTNRIQVEQM